MGEFLIHYKDKDKFVKCCDRKTSSVKKRACEKLHIDEEKVTLYKQANNSSMWAEIDSSDEELESSVTELMLKGTSPDGTRTPEVNNSSLLDFSAILKSTNDILNLDEQSSSVSPTQHGMDDSLMCDFSAQDRNTEKLEFTEMGSVSDDIQTTTNTTTPIIRNGKDKSNTRKSPSASSSMCLQGLKPWPNTFEVPVFRPDVEKWLQGKPTTVVKDMKVEIVRHLQVIMLQHTISPTKLQYQQVAVALVRKHRCLEDPSPGSKDARSSLQWKPHGSWCIALSRKFRNDKVRIPSLKAAALEEKSRKRAAQNELESASKLPRASPTSLDQFPVGEDEHSLKKYDKDLALEWKKKQNGADPKILDLCKLTFHSRQQMISSMTNVTDLISDFKAKYPAVLTVEGVTQEMELLHNKNFIALISAFFTNNSAALKGVIGQSKSMKMQALRQRFEASALPVDYKEQLLLVLGLSILVGDKHESLIQDSDIQVLAGEPQIVGNKIWDEQNVFNIYFQAEPLITCNNIFDAIGVVISIAYLFNVEYFHEVRKFYQFFQKYVLKFNDVMHSAVLHKLSLKFNL